MTTKPNEPETLDLRPWGYAPGSYFVKCIDCPEKPTTEWPLGDKRSIRCEQHAREAMGRASSQPVADAGGVTETDREAADAISVALLQCVPPDIDLTHFRLSVAGLFVRHRLQSVAAATAGMPTIWEDPAGKGYPCFERPMTPAEAKAALDQDAQTIIAKDAEIARIMRVIDVFRRHYELNDCDGRTGNIEIPVSALRAAASLSSALSEAREAGE
jgi:hypothetical protein